MNPKEEVFEELLEKLLSNPPLPPKSIDVDFDCQNIYELFKVLSYIFTEILKNYNLVVNEIDFEKVKKIDFDVLKDDFIDWVNAYMRSFGIKANYLKINEKKYDEELKLSRLGLETKHYSDKEMLEISKALVPHRYCKSNYLKDYNLIIRTDKWIHSINFLQE
jgi:hypothetical protein